MKSKPLSEVQKELKSIGIKVTDRTIKNYVNQKLAPKPVKVGGGYGVETEYPWDMAAWFAASHELISKDNMPMPKAVKATKTALHIIKSGNYIEEDLKGDKKLERLLGADTLTALLAGLWLGIYLNKQQQLYQTDRKMHEAYAEARRKAEKAYDAEAVKRKGEWERAKREGGTYAMDGAVVAQMAEAVEAQQAIRRRCILRCASPMLVKIAQSGQTEINMKEVEALDGFVEGFDEQFKGFWETAKSDRELAAYLRKGSGGIASEDLGDPRKKEQLD